MRNSCVIGPLCTKVRVAGVSLWKTLFGSIAASIFGALWLQKCKNRDLKGVRQQNEWPENRTRTGLDLKLGRQVQDITQIPCAAVKTFETVNDMVFWSHELVNWDKLSIWSQERNFGPFPAFIRRLMTTVGLESCVLLSQWRLQWNLEILKLTSTDFGLKQVYFGSIWARKATRWREERLRRDWTHLSSDCSSPKLVTLCRHPLIRIYFLFYSATVAPLC